MGWVPRFARGRGAGSLWSRLATNSTAGFPEVVDAIMDVPGGCVLDGELVIWLEGRLDFDTLQRRASAGRRRAAQLARAFPASHVAFDLLAVLGRDIRHHPLDIRRQLLEELAMDWDAPCSCHLSRASVRRRKSGQSPWRRPELRDRGEGSNQPCTLDRREWMKVRRRQTLHVVVGAVIGSRARPEAVVVGRPDGERLRIVGRFRALKASESRTLGATASHARRASMDGSLCPRFRR